MKKDFIKINIEDIEQANEFFDGNERQLNEFLIGVINYYQGKEVKIKNKLVKKYFNLYKKTMDFILKAKIDGKYGSVIKAENERVKNETLKGSVKGSVKDTHSTKEVKRKRSKEVKKIIGKNVLLTDLKKSDVSNPDHLLIARMFYGLFKKNLSNLNISTKKIEEARGAAWIDPIRLMLDNDNRTLDEFREVYDFIERTPFWHGNILSTDKLRKQFEKLLIQSRNEKNKRNNTEGTTINELANILHRNFD